VGSYRSRGTYRQADSYPLNNHFSGHIGEPGFGVFANDAIGGFCCDSFFVAPGSYLIQDVVSIHGAQGFVDLDGTHFTCPSQYGDPNHDCSAGILVFYILTLPDIDVPLFEPIVLTAPLTVDAWVGLLAPPCERFDECFYGEGTGVGLATVTLLSRGDKT
jgi:hypothetical protein